MGDTASQGGASSPRHTLIRASHDPLDLHLDELWQYRDLVWLLTKRSFVVTYKQTILGPLWLLLTPLCTSLVYVVLFGNIAQLSTGGVPQLLFYLVGSALWTYFSSCVTKNARTFVDNAHIFGKVYFPRLVVPISQVLGALIRLGIQLLMALALIAYYTARGTISPHGELVWSVPFLLLQLGLLGMGCGIIISSLTTRYRDLGVLVDFGVSLWMYVTPVVYPLSSVEGSLHRLLAANPATAPFECLRYVLLGVGEVTPALLLSSLVATLAITFFGMLIFTNVERTFMDTV